MYRHDSDKTTTYSMYMQSHPLYQSFHHNINGKRPAPPLPVRRHGLQL